MKKTHNDQEQWEKDLCAFVVTEQQEGKQYTSHLDDKADNIYLMMRGERVKKGYDWQSNLSLNKVFPAVNTFVSYCCQKIYGATPVIGVKGFNKKGAWQREVILEKFMGFDNYFITVVMGLIRLALNGVCFEKKTWEQELIDNNGQMIPVKDGPKSIIVSNKDIVVDSLLNPGQSCKEGRYIIHRAVVDMGTLYKSNNYINLDLIDPQTQASTEHEMDHGKVKQKDHLEDPVSPGIYQDVEILEAQQTIQVKETKKGLRPVLEVDDIDYEKNQTVEMIITIANPKNPVLIRWELNKYGEKNYTDGHLHLDPERWPSMGLIEPVMDTQSAIDDNINAIFDLKNRNLAPPVIANKMGLIDWDTIQYAPNQVWMVTGNPKDLFHFPDLPTVDNDAWKTHAILSQDFDIGSNITPPVTGMGKDKTATMGVLNAEFSTDALNFLISMIEKTWLTPSAQQTIRFAQLFSHPLTMVTMLNGEAFQFDGWMEEYHYTPVASTVKTEQQREVEIQQDIQLLQTVSSIQNPGTPVAMNFLMANIFRNRNRPELAKFFDENFMPEGGGVQAGQPGGEISPGATQNEYGLEQPQAERGLRQRAQAVAP